MKVRKNSKKLKAEEIEKIFPLMASHEVLARDWLSKEDEKAWKDP